MRLPKGYVLEAISDAAKAEMDPMAALDQMEQAWRQETLALRAGRRVRASARRDQRPTPMRGFTILS